MSELTLNEKTMNEVMERMTALTAEGIVVSEEPSGELNFSGCHRGYCQAWD